MAKLAINGGTPVRSGPFPSWTTYTQRDEKGLLDTYYSDNWGPDGEKNREFQKTFAEFSGVKHCLTVANGTVSIELILRALGLGRGDEVIVPPYTFIASISALIYAGVKPVFADVDEETFQLSAEAAEKVITPRTKAIMPVYVGGRPADLDAFTALCEKYGLYLIGDAAQAAGAEYKGKGIGNYGIATSISCQNSKNLTCGEGGLVLTNDDALYEKMVQLLRGGVDAAGNYSGLGLNNGMSEFQASMLCSQFAAFPEQVARRQRSGELLDELLADIDLVKLPPKDPKITRNAYHLYLFRFNREKLGDIPREKILSALRAEGIGCAPGYLPVYTFPCMQGDYIRKCLGSDIDVNPDAPNTEQLCNETGCWFLQNMMLSDKKTIMDIAAALRKISDNLDELR